MNRLIWAAALIGTVIRPVLADVARVNQPFYDGRVLGLFCDGAANSVRPPVDASRTMADLRAGDQIDGYGGSNACVAFLDSAAYAYAFAATNAPEGCCHGARERFRFGVPNLPFGQTDAVPEPSTQAMMMIGVAGLGLVAYFRTIRNRAAAAA